MAAVAVQLLRIVLHGAAARGVPPAQLLAAAGLTDVDLADADAFLPISADLRLWSEAARLTGDPHFGLHLAEHGQIGDFGGLGYAVRSSATVGDGYTRAIRYLRLLHRELALAVELRDDEAHIAAITPPLVPPYHAPEYLLATLLLVGRREAGPAFTAREVRFRHPAPPDTAEHRRLFAAPVRFSQPRDVLVLDRAHLALPMQHAEPGLCDVLDRHLAELIERQPTHASFLERARGCLAAELKAGTTPTVERVAKRLHMSPRSLQRRLQQDGTSLQDLLAAVRTDLAIRHLRERRESIAEVAFLLGFADVSAFHRAFKKWTGVTPTAYRESLAPT